MKEYKLFASVIGNDPAIKDFILDSMTVGDMDEIM